MGRSSMLLAGVAFVAGAAGLVSMFHNFIDEIKEEDQAPISQMGSRIPIAAARSKDHRLHPSKLISKIGDLDFASLWKNDYNVVHVINTEFLQHQQDLSSLIQARIDLFKTFTLPSMRQQSNQQFLWLIWTDREISDELEKEMQNIAKDMPQIVVLGTEKDESYNLRKLYGHGWTPLSKIVVAGNSQLLSDYYEASKTHVLLETRLDADDALSNSFVDSMQIQAAVAIGRNPDARPGKMEIFCPESHVEWRYFSPDEDEEEQDQGKLVHFHNHDFCISSGLTQVFNVDQPSFLEATFRGRQLQSNECSLQVVNPHNCEITSTYQNCGSTRHLAELFFDTPGEKSNEKNSQQQGNLRNNDENRQLQSSLLDPKMEMEGNGVCKNATAIPEPAATFFETLDVYNPNQCAPGTFACRTLNYTAIQLNIDDTPGPPVFIDGVMTPSDVAVLKTENGFVSECTPVDCSEDRVYLQIVAETGALGEIQNLGISIVQESINWGGYVYTIDQIQVIYSNTTTENHFSKDQACASLFTAVSADGALAGSDAIFLPNEEFQAAEQALQKDLQCSSTKMSGVAVCVAPAEYFEACECVRKLRLIPEDAPDETPMFKPLQASVLMSKTPTTAGMKNVMPDTSGGGKHSVKLNTFSESQDEAWKEMEQSFGVSEKSVNKLRERMDGNMEHILFDAFAGQCSPGHSCKDSAKRALGRLLTKIQERNL